MNLNIALLGHLNEHLLASKSPVYLQKYRYSIEQFITYLRRNFLPITTDSLTQENIQNYLLWGLKERKWGKYTLHTYYTLIGVFCNWLIKKGELATNPLDQIQKPKLPSGTPQALSESEIVSLLQAVTKLPYVYGFSKIRNIALVATFIFTGIRRSELIGLKVEDVDLVNKFIFIRHGKGDKQREVPIEEVTLLPILQEYSEYRKRLGRANTYFFNGQWAGFKENNKLGAGAINNLFKKVSKMMKKRIHAHKLRHSFATWVLDREGDLFTLKELMGHANIRTTSIYLSASKRKKVEVIGKLKLMQEV